MHPEFVPYVLLGISCVVMGTLVAIAMIRVTEHPQICPICQAPLNGDQLFCKDCDDDDSSQLEQSE